MDLPQKDWQVLPNSQVANEYAFDIHQPDEYRPLPSCGSDRRLPMYIHGYFFNKRYYHHERAYVLRLFDMHEAIKQYADAFYGRILRYISMA